MVFWCPIVATKSYMNERTDLRQRGGEHGQCSHIQRPPAAQRGVNYVCAPLCNATFPQVSVFYHDSTRLFHLECRHWSPPIEKSEGTPRHDCRMRMLEGRYERSSNRDRRVSARLLLLRFFEEPPPTKSIDGPAALPDLQEAIAPSPMPAIAATTPCPITSSRPGRSMISFPIAKYRKGYGRGQAITLPSSQSCRRSQLFAPIRRARISSGRVRIATSIFASRSPYKTKQLVISHSILQELIGAYSALDGRDVASLKG